MFIVYASGISLACGLLFWGLVRDGWWAMVGHGLETLVGGQICQEW